VSCSDVTAPLPLPDLESLRPADLRAWRDRLRRLAWPALALVALAVVALTIDGPGRAFADALGRALDANPRWVAVGLGFEVLSFAGYAALLWHVAGRDAPRLDLRTSAQLTLAGTAAARVLPTAGAGGAALTLWTLGRAGHRGRAGVRTLLTFLVLLYAVFLSCVLVSGSLVAAGVGASTGPRALAALPAALAGAGIVVALALALRRPRDRTRLVGATSPRAARLRSGAEVLSEAVREALALVRTGDLRLLGAVAWWAFDVGVLWAMFQAFGSHPPLAVLVLAYFLGQVANTLPLPGAVSGGTVGVLLAFGAPAGVSLAAVLAYRTVAIWTPGLAGLAALAALRSTLARWTQEDSPRGGAAEPTPRPAWTVVEAVAA
jgi:putative heme transporter